MKTGLSKPIAGEAVSRYFSALGKVGGLRRTKKKTEAARLNANKPCAEGKRRGRPPNSKKKMPVPIGETIAFQCGHCGKELKLTGEPIALLRTGRHASIAVKCGCGAKTALQAVDLPAPGSGTVNPSTPTV